MEIFQDYAYYYNSFYNDKDYRAEAQSVDGILKNITPGFGTWSILAAGQGDMIWNLKSSATAVPEST